MNQLLRYTVCVLISSAVNYVAQEALFYFLPHIMGAMIFGIGASLVVKYFLVKKYAFMFKTRGKKHEARVFFSYGAWGVFATLIFCAIELGFHYYVDIPYSRQTGTVLGLLISGYIKFILDRDYVFSTPSEINTSDFIDSKK